MKERVENGLSRQITFSQTIQYIKGDLNRVRQFQNIGPGFFKTAFIFCLPSFLCLHLYRWSHYFYMKGFRSVARFLWLIGLYLTGADLAPNSIIGKECYIGHSVGTHIHGKVGDRLLLFGGGGIGGGTGRDRDVGAGPGYPMVGDDVSIGYGGVVLGPISIGDNAQICACSFVTRDVPEGKMAIGNPAKISKMMGQVRIDPKTDKET